MTIDNFLEFIRDETGRTPHTEWAICSRCHGNGTVGGWAGTYTEADRADWSPEDYEDYRTTTRHCESCSGTGKVRTIPAESPVAHEWEQWLQDEADDRAVRRAESGYSW